MAASEVRYRRLFESAKDGILILDADTGTVVDVNPFLIERLGFSRQQFIGKKIWELGFFKDVIANQVAFAELQQHEYIRYEDKPLETADGHRIDVEFVSNVYLVNGQKVIQCNIRDITTRKRTEAALRNNEQKYRELVEHANSIILRWTRDGKITFLNGFGQKFFGYSNAEILGRHVVGTIVPSNAAIPGDLGVMIKRIGAHPETFEQNINENMRRNGERVWVAWANKLVLDEQGEVKEILSVGSDITERIQMETALKKSEERYRLLFERSPDGIFAIAPTGVIAALNPAFETITGWPRAQWLGRPFLELIHPGDQARAGAEFQAALGGVSGAMVELRVRSALGGFRDVEFMGFSSVLNGQGVEVQGSGRDITERKRAEEALRKEQALFNSLASTIPDHIYFKDRQSRFVRINDAQARRFGMRSPDEAVGKTDLDIFTDEHARRAYADEQRLMETGEPIISLHEKETWPDGSVTWVSTTKVALRDSEGRITGLVGVSRDITEQKLLEEKFLHAQRLESIGMLAAGIAHDLNNVLAPIMFAAPMLRDSLTSERDRRILATLENSAHRGAGLVKQILGFAHSTTGDFRSVQVKHLARDIISVIEETFPKSIALRHEIPSELWPVQGNPTQIHQVLMNLCVNARDAMPQGGTLNITAANRRLDAADAVALVGARPGDWLVLTVSDTGTGIPPEVMGNIWTPFFTTKGVGKGTGLGLTTIRSIVASHRGFITLDTAVGQGTTFRVYLPAAESADAKKKSATPFAYDKGNGELILVVDDDAAIRTLVAAILRKFDYRVQQCEDGLDAITFFHAQPDAVALVITDVDMPRIGGLALARTMRQIRPDIRILVMSGLSHHEGTNPDLPTIRDMANGYLNKPFVADALLAAVNQALHPPGRIQPA